MTTRYPQLLTLALYGWFVTMYQGCVVHSVDENPEPAVLGENIATGENASGKWWDTFEDKELEKLMDAALEENPNLHAVSLRIDQASGRYKQTRAGLFPTVSGDANLLKAWDKQGKERESASAGLFFDWELDVFGRIRYAVAAQQKEVKATVEDWQAARLLLTASVAQTWFELVEQRGQLQLAKEQIKLAQTLLDLTRLRAGQGQGSAVAVLQQKEQLQSIETRIPDIESRIQTLKFILDALLGKLPGKGKHGKQSELHDLETIPEAGIPSGSLIQHPALWAHRERLIALDHKIGEAIADQFPRFAIGGSASGSGTPQIEDLIGDAFAGVVGPIFDAGSRKAEVAIRRYRLQEAMALYTAKFIAAVRDVETALIQEQKLVEKLSRQEAQLQTARDLLEESRNRYILGASDYLPVLDAVSKVHQLERDFLTSQRQRLSARVNLHRALGGPMPEANLP